MSFFFFLSEQEFFILENLGYMGHESTLDFLSYNAYLLVPVIGGGLVLVVGLLAVVSCYCR